MIPLNAQDLAELFDFNETSPVAAAKVTEALSGDQNNTDNLLMLLAVISQKANTATTGTGKERSHATDDLLLGLDNLLNAVFRWSSAHQESRDSFIKQLLNPKRKGSGA